MLPPARQTDSKPIDSTVSSPLHRSLLLTPLLALVSSCVGTRNLQDPVVVIETRGVTRLFIWPAFALRPPADPTPDERQTMLACVRFADLGRADKAGRPPPMRIGIAADGVWHYFWSADPE